MAALSNCALSSQRSGKYLTDWDGQRPYLSPSICVSVVSPCCWYDATFSLDLSRRPAVLSSGGRYPLGLEPLARGQLASAILR